MILSPDLVDIERMAQSDAERRVARVLQALESRESVAFHSVALRSHRYKQLAEADFVVLWKGVVVVLEVKGGGVSKVDGVWYSVDRNRNAHRLPTSPMEQARSAMFALRDIFKEDGLGWFPSEAIVLTPDVEAPPPSHEWKSSHWLGKDSMSSAALARALDEVVSGAPEPPRNAMRARIDELRTHLFGEFSRVPLIDAQRGAVIDEQNSATIEQARVLAGLAKNPRILVSGGAGTGKSIVLAEAAKQEHDAGRRTLVTFKSPGLHRFFDPLLKGRDVTVLEFDALDTSEQFDVVLIDEAQDLMSIEAMGRLDKVLQGGLSTGRWRMFLDKNNQAQVDGEFDDDVYELMATDSMEYDLTKNVRNTRAIVRLVQDYLHADVGDPGIVNGEKVQWDRFTGEESTLHRAFGLARDMARSGIPASHIWVIPFNAEIDAAEARGISVMTPRDAKGLEVDHVIACSLPPEYDDKAVAELYVAVTRARVSLHIVATAGDKKRIAALERKLGS